MSAKITLRPIEMTPEVMRDLERRGIIIRLAPGNHDLSAEPGKTVGSSVYDAPESLGPHKLIAVSVNRTSLSAFGAHPGNEEFLLLGNYDRKRLYLVIALHRETELQELIRQQRLSADDFLCLRVKYNDPETSFFTMLAGVPHGEAVAESEGEGATFYVAKPRDLGLAQTDLGDFELTFSEGQWPKEKAWRWYREVAPICGFNYLPRSAVNPTEMWQELDEAIIEQELAWAKQCGLSSARVFLQYHVYEADPTGLLARIERFLEIASRQRISVMLVPFDDCWKQDPAIGPQPNPIPGVHNSQWTASPGELSTRRENWPNLKRFVQALVSRFSGDKRVLAWDLYNEPTAAH